MAREGELNNRVSVVMPVYNAAKYLREALDSLINQTYKNTEIICVDDGSTDESYEILNEYKNNYGISVYKQEKESNGAGLARNLGLSKASGSYIAFVDADDFFDEKMIEKSYSIAISTNADVVMFYAWRYDCDAQIDREANWGLHDKYLPDKDTFSPSENARYVFQMTDGSAWGKLFRLEYIKEIGLQFDDLRYTDDAGFTFPAICLAKKISVLREPLLHYRWGDSDSQTIKAKEYPEVSYSAPVLIREKLLNYGVYDIYKVSFLNFFVMLSRLSCERYMDADCLTHAFEHLKKLYSEYGVFEMEEKHLGSKLFIDFKNSVQNESPLQYLLSKKKESSNRWNDFCKRIGKNLPRGENCSVVIYGAGARGWNLYNYLKIFPSIRVVGWVDREYQKMGFPIERIDYLFEKKWDYVLVAIENKSIAEEVKNNLLEMGISKEKILWIFES